MAFRFVFAVYFLTYTHLAVAQSSTVAATSSAASPSSSSSSNGFEWGAVGDSWTSGVAYSSATVYSKTDFEYCYRTNQAWSALMEADTTWTTGTQNFHFAGCGGTLMNDIPRQMGKTGNSQMIMGTIGGNNALFGDIARACIYQPAPGGWGPAWDNDPDGTGECKKNLAKSQDYINRAEGGLRDDFKGAIDNIINYKSQNGQMQPRFDLYVSSYVEFWNNETTACNDWTFARWFSAGYPKLVQGLRTEMNILVDAFNAVQADVISNYNPEVSATDYRVHYIPVSDQFQGHRFCEQDATFDDQWTSSNTYIWNLQWNDGDTGGTSKPDGAPNGYGSNDSFPVMSLDTQNRTDLDDLLFNGTDVNAQSQSGFGWTARPFHPKPLGYQAMKDFFIQRLKNDDVPGVQGASPVSASMSSPSPTPAPTTLSTVTSAPASSTVSKGTTCDCNEDGCTPESPDCCANGTCPT